MKIRIAVGTTEKPREVEVEAEPVIIDYGLPFRFGVYRRGETWVGPQWELVELSTGRLIATAESRKRAIECARVRLRSRGLAALYGKVAAAPTLNEMFAVGEMEPIPDGPYLEINCGVGGLNNVSASHSPRREADT